jgi:hypothetical protein
MADDLIPPRIRNGGTGSVQVGEARGPDYRQLQSPEQVNTDLPNNGAAARAAALGSLFKEFEGVSADVLNKAQTQAGALAGAASGNTGHPDYKAGLARFTAYGQAFNNAATGAYAVEAEAQADDAAARLRVQANNNPATFNATYSAVRDAVLKNAPPMAVPMLTELYNKKLAAGLAAISGDQAAQQQQLQRQTYDEGVQRQTSRVANLQGSDNPNDQAAAADEHVKLSLLIDGGVNAGLYSPAEAQAMHVNAMRQVTGQVFSTQVDRELARPDGDVVSLVNNFRAAHEKNLADTNSPPILSEPEFQKLMGDATTKIREWNLTIAMNKRGDKTAEQMRFEAGDVQYTHLFLTHQLTESGIDEGLRNGDLKPETARTLRSQMLGGDTQVKSDPRALLKLHTDPSFLSMDNNDIINTPGINATDQLKAIQERDRRNGSWEGTQAAKQGRGAIDAALKIPPGTNSAGLSDAQKTARAEAQQEYITLMNATDPAHRDSSAASVAQTVIKHAHQREAAADVNSYTIGRQSFIDKHGPASQTPMDKANFERQLKWYDDNIAQSRLKAKGE